MSALGNLRKKWHYERSVPRCELCVNYQASRWYLVRDSLPRTSAPICKAAGFTVRPMGVCDKWKTQAGQCLIDNPEIDDGRNTKPKNCV